MTKYTVWLWPGFGAELKPFIVEASYEQEALETVGESLKGTGFTISGDEYMDMVAEYVADGYTEDEAEGMVSEQYYPINGGEYYLFILNARIDPVEGSSNGKPKGRRGSGQARGTRRQCFTVGGDPTVYAIDVPDVGGYIEAAMAYDAAHGTDFADRVDPSAWFGGGCGVGGRSMGASVPRDARVISSTSQIGSRGSKPGKGKGSPKRHKRLFGSKNVGYKDLPKKARDHPGYIPGNRVRLPNGTVAYAESEVSLLDGQEPGAVSYWTSVCDDDGNWWDVVFTFDLDYLKATPWEAVDWSGHISEVQYDPDMSGYASANRGIGGRGC